MPRARRKELQVEHARSLPPDAVAVKVADKIANVEDLAVRPPAGWDAQRISEYLDWAEAVVDECRGSNRALLDHFHTALERARSAVGA